MLFMKPDKFFEMLKKSLKREFLTVLADKKRNVYTQFMYMDDNLRWEFVSNEWLKKKKLSDADMKALLDQGFQTEKAPDHQGILRESNFFKDVANVSDENLKKIIEQSIKILTEIYGVPEKNKLKYTLP